MQALLTTKTVCDDFCVEYEVLPVQSSDNVQADRSQQIANRIAEVNQQINKNIDYLHDFDIKIDNLTSSADALDNMVAVGSGIIAGIVDSIFVGEFSLESANDWGSKKANNFVVKIAQSKGYKGNDLLGAVEFLEDKYKIAADKATNDFGGGLQHHLRDFSHHPTPIGLTFSLLTQFTNKIFGTDVNGVFKVVQLKEDDLILIGKNFQEKLTFGMVNWFFHLVSDMAGSSSSIREGKYGTGLPGPIGSLLKELSALPIFSKMNKDASKEFSVWISKLFNGTLLGKDGVPMKFDLRTEIGIANELGRQAIPVVINECIVRGFYFVRRLCMEICDNDIKKISDLKNINWKRTLPFKNRTVVRMVTIAATTFTLVDTIDAAIRSAVASAGNPAAFAGNMLCRVNFVGLGRCVIAIGTDAVMGAQLGKYRSERIAIMNQQLSLQNAKIYYLQADVWLAAESAAEAIDQAAKAGVKATLHFVDSLQENQANLNSIGDMVSGVQEHNPDLLSDMTDILKWG